MGYRLTGHREVRYRFGARAFLGTAAWVFLLALMLAPGRVRAEEAPAKQDANAAVRAAYAARMAFAEQAGVDIVRIAISGSGGLIDLRYRVLDVGKAMAIHDKNRPLAIIDEASGGAASRPWMDHMRAGGMKTTVTYYELIANPAGVIKRGKPVTLVIGDARLEHVIVQ